VVPFASAFGAGGRISLSAPRLTLLILDVSGTQVPGGLETGSPGTIFVRDLLGPDGALLAPPAAGGEAVPGKKAP
jgi:hypothetical protein